MESFSTIFFAKFLILNVYGGPRKIQLQSQVILAHFPMLIFLDQYEV